MSAREGVRGFVESNRGMRYAIAVFAVALATALRLVVDPLVGLGQVLFTFTPAVVVAARLGGLGPGLVATALSVLATLYFLLEPRFSFGVANPREIGSLAMFAILNVCVSLFVAERPQSPGKSEPKADRSFVRRMALFGGALVLLVALTRVMYGDFERERSREELVSRTYQVLGASQVLLANLQDAETGQRGFLLTGDESYLEPFERARATQRRVRQMLRELTIDNERQQARMDEVDLLVAARYATLEAAIALRRERGREAGIAAVATGEGKRAMDEFRAVLNSMQDEERRLLAVRAEAAEALSKRMHWVFGLGSASLLMLLVGAGTVIERDSRSRERARIEAGENAQRLRLALDAAAAGTWEWDTRTNENVWSEEIWKLYGLTPHSRVPSYDAWREIVHPDDRARAEETVAQAAARGTELNVEFRVNHGSGGERWLQSRGRRLSDGEHGGTRFVGIVLDITARKQAEEALKERERTLRSFAEFAPVAIAMFDGQMNYLAASRRFREDFGLGEQELTGRSHYELFPEISEAWREIHRRCLAGASERSPGELFVRADGREQWVRWEIRPWHRSDGEIGGVVLYTEEITEQKRAELEIRLLNAQLEERVRQRTVELESANKELEAFSYSVSHDLRAPLRGIDGWSLALKEDYASQLDQQAQGYIDRVRAETQRMGLLIDDLLQLAQVSRVETYMSEVDLTEAAQYVTGSLKEANQDRAIEFVIAPGLKARGDSRLLEIVLTNLLSNAVKFSKRREQARIEFGRTLDEGKPAFFVSDNGVGFSMEYADRLFRAFQRLHRASEYPGTGIGLATVRRIIQRHGGEVWAEAQVDRGATFYFTIGETA